MHSETDVPAAYDIGGQHWVKDAPGFAEAIAQAFEQRLRPRCLCGRNPDGQGLEMYVARILNGYIVKRMPNTGSQHATHCPSYEPPAEFSGLGLLLGTAIVENPATGQTTLKLDFSMTKLPGRSKLPTAASASSRVVSQGPKLGLRALLHYLWDQAELTHWQPGFAGRRSWGTVRKHLLRAAENKLTHGHALVDSLYIPEVFSVEQREAIAARRLRQWAHAQPQPGRPQHLMVMVAEVKEILPSRYGHKAMFKHLPDQPFALDEPLYRRLGRCFEQELSTWSAEPDLHLIMAATFRVDEASVPGIVEISLMLTTAQWLPVDDAWDRELVGALVRNGRRFIKGLRYNGAPGQHLIAASLLDCGGAPWPLLIARKRDHCERLQPECLPQTYPADAPLWHWSPSDGNMPALPPKQRQHPANPLPQHLQADPNAFSRDPDAVPSPGPGDAACSGAWTR